MSLHRHREVLHTNWLVQTPQGPAKVVQRQSKPLLYEFELLEKPSHGQVGGGALPLAHRFRSAETYPSVTPTIGSEVLLLQALPGQRGRVVEVRPGHAVVHLVSWRLFATTSGHSSPSYVKVYCRLNHLQVLAPKILQDMTIYEKLLYIQERKQLAVAELRGDTVPALHALQQAIDVIRQLLYKPTTCTRPTRAYLILNLISCYHHQAIAQWYRKEYQAMAQAAINALTLIQALQQKSSIAKRFKDPTVVAGRLRVTGTWKIKSLLLLGQAMTSLKEYVAAIPVLEQGLAICRKCLINKRYQALQEWPQRQAVLLAQEADLMTLLDALHGKVRRGSGTTVYSAAALPLSVLLQDDDETEMPDDDDDMMASLPLTPSRPYTPYDPRNPNYRGSLKHVEHGMAKTPDTAPDSDDDLVEYVDYRQGDGVVGTPPRRRSRRDLSVQCLVPDDPNLAPCDEKVFVQRDVYLDQVGHSPVRKAKEKVVNDDHHLLPAVDDNTGFSLQVLHHSQSGFQNPNETKDESVQQ